MTILLSIAIAMVVGVLLTRITKHFNMPDVTAYLIAGILIGPACLGRLGIEGLGFTTFESVEELELLSNLALGFIAFALGSEFMLPKLRTIGRQAVIIGIAQALITVVFVGGALILLHFIIPDKLSLPTAIVMAAIASATAPAATLLVVQQFKAKGAVTDILLPVVALDDAVGLVCFAVAMGIARSLIGGDVGVVSIVINPIIEIVGSLVLGTILGFVLTLLERWFHANKNRMIFVVSIVILTVALSMMEFEIGEVEISFSSLLVCMMMGTVFCNTCPVAEDLMGRADKWTAPLYCLFFVMSGAALQFSVFTDITIVLVGVVYIIFRTLGKYFGSRWSAKATKCPPQVIKYLGITLLPQAGVSLGMSITAASLLGETGSLIRSLTLFAVLIYELIGPSLTKWALTRSGDIKPKSEEVLHRREKMLRETAESRSIAEAETRDRYKK